MRLAPVLVVLGAAVLMVAWRRSLPGRGFEPAYVEDMASVRNLVQVVGHSDELPMKDGKLDVYAIVVLWEIGETLLDVFTSARFKYGPTEEQILGGDYSSFPYERYAGPVPPPEGAPLLWDKVPDENGKRVVGLRSGVAEYLDEAEVQALLKKYGQLPKNSPPAPK